MNKYFSFFPYWANISEAFLLCSYNVFNKLIRAKPVQDAKMRYNDEIRIAQSRGDIPTEKSDWVVSDK